MDQEFGSLTVIHAERNYGFAGGNNIGISRAFQKDVQYVFLLNDDAVIERDTISVLATAMHRHPEAGSLQPLIVNIFDRQTVEAYGHQLLAKGGAEPVTIRSEVSNDQEFEIFGPCAAAALYRRAALEDVGLFDSRLFIIHEDADLSIRLQLSGWRAFLISRALAFHAWGVSGKIGKQSPSFLFYTGRNNLIILFRYWPLKYLLLYAPLHILRYVRVVRWAIVCRYDLSSLHFILFRAFRERKVFRQRSHVREFRNKWIMPKGYVYELKRVLHVLSSKL